MRGTGLKPLYWAYQIIGVNFHIPSEYIFGVK